MKNTFPRLVIPTEWWTEQQETPQQHRDRLEMRKGDIKSMTEAKEQCVRGGKRTEAILGGP